MALHVDLTAHIDNTFGREGEFAPRVGHLAVDHLGIGVDSRPSTRQTGGEGDLLYSTWRHAQCDQWLVYVDPRARRPPNDKNEVLTSIVGKGVCIVASSANPGGCASDETIKSRENGERGQLADRVSGEQVTFGDTNFHCGWLSLLLGVEMLMAME